MWARLLPQLPPPSPDLSPFHPFPSPSLLSRTRFVRGVIGRPAHGIKEHLTIILCDVKLIVDT